MSHSAAKTELMRSTSRVHIIAKLIEINCHVSIPAAW